MSFPQLNCWDFAFSPESPMSSGEAIAEYRPGGFHPITIGMIICSAKSRYRVIQKLGFGAYNTVWLVEDLDQRGCKALRVSKAAFSSEGEEDVLNRIVSESASPSPHFPVIFDQFIINGPNGSHKAIVSEILAPVWDALPSLLHVATIPGSLDCASSDLPADSQTQGSISTRKSIVRSLVEAVADLYARGIVHGDLHFSNVGLPIPALTDGRDKEYIRVCPEVTVVLPVNPAISNFAAHFPPYIVQRWDFYNYIKAIGGDQVSPVVKLFDFGSAHCVERPHRNSGFMYQIIPPEWYIQGTDIVEAPTAAFDTWALGLMIFCLVTGGMYPYSAVEGSSSFVPMARLSGRIPDSWKKIYTWTSDPRLASDVSEETCAQTWAGFRQYFRPNCASDADMEALISLLRRILVLDPAERPSAADILQDAWLAADVES
ncbi:kinase-like protein [Peniophora sp. CONT]|nr:kinase-like protein [Peniophora sp. CONT]